MVRPSVLRRSARLLKMPLPEVMATETEARQWSSKILPPAEQQTEPALRQHSSKVQPPEVIATEPESRQSFSSILPPEITSTKPKLKCSRKIPPAEMKQIEPVSRKHSNRYANRASHLKKARLKMTKCSSSKLRRTNRSKAGQLTKTRNVGALYKTPKPRSTEKAEYQRATGSSGDGHMSEDFLPESLKKPQTRKDRFDAVKDCRDAQAKKGNYSTPIPAIVDRPKRIRKGRRDLCSCCKTVPHETFGTSPPPLIRANPMRRKEHRPKDGAMKFTKKFTTKEGSEDVFARKKVEQSDCSISETTKQYIRRKREGLQVIDQVRGETSMPEMSEGTRVVRSHTAKHNGHRVLKSNTSSTSSNDSPERKKASRTPTSRHNKYQRFTCMETGVAMHVNCHAILEAFRQSKSKKYSKHCRSSKAMTDAVTSKPAKSPPKLTHAQSPKSIHLNVPCQTSQSTGIAQPTSDQYEASETEDPPVHSSSRTNSKTLPFFEQYTELEHSRDLDDQLTCHLCGLLFTGRCAIERHMAVHCNSKTPICFCALCNKTFVEFEQLEAHVLTCRRFQRLEMEEESRKGPELDENMNMMHQEGDFADYYVDFRSDAVSTSGNRLSLSEDYPMEVVGNTDDVPTEMLSLSGNDGHLHDHNIDLDEEIDPVSDDSCNSAYVCEICGLKFAGIFSLTDHYWVHEPKMVPFEDAGTVSQELAMEPENTTLEKFRWDAERSLVYRKDDGQSISNQHGKEFASADDKDTTVALSLAEPNENIKSSPNTDRNTSECEQTVLLDLSNCVRRSNNNEHSFQSSSACAYPRAIPNSEHEEPSINNSSVGPIANSQIHDDGEAVLFDVSNRLSQSCDPVSSTIRDLHPSATQSSGVEGGVEPTCNPVKGNPAEKSESLYKCHQCQEKFQSEANLQDHMQQMGHLGVVQYVTVCSLEELQGFESYKALQLNVGAVEVCLEDDANQTYVVQGYSDNSTSLVQENILTNYRDVDILCQQCGKSFRNNMVLGHAPCFLTSEEEQKYAVQELFESEVHIPSPVDKRGQYHCSKCLTTFPTRKALDKHIKTHMIGKECHICGKIVRTAFMDHVKSHNVELQQTSSVCEVCEELFPSMQALACHQSTKHNFITQSGLGLTYRCPHCKEELNNTPSFIAHVAAHTGVYPFECSVCKRGYLYKAALNYHLVQYHSNNQGYDSSTDGTSIPQTWNESTALHWENGHERNAWSVEGPRGLEQQEYWAGEQENNQSMEHEVKVEPQGIHEQYQLEGYYPSAEYETSAHCQPSVEWNWRKHDDGTWKLSREYEQVPVIHTGQNRSMWEEHVSNREGSKSMPSDLSVHSGRFEHYDKYTSEDVDQELTRRYTRRAMEQEDEYQRMQHQWLEFDANLPQPKDATGMEFTHSTYTQQMQAQEERFGANLTRPKETTGIGFTDITYMQQEENLPGYSQQVAIAERHSGCVDQPVNTDCIQTLCENDVGRDDLYATGQEAVGEHCNVVQKELNLQIHCGATEVEHFTGRGQILQNGNGNGKHLNDNLRCEKQLTSKQDCAAHQDKPASHALPHFGEAFSKLRIPN